MLHSPYHVISHYIISYHIIPYHVFFIFGITETFRHVESMSRLSCDTMKSMQVWLHLLVQLCIEQLEPWKINHWDGGSFHFFFGVMKKSKNLEDLDDVWGPGKWLVWSTVARFDGAWPVAPWTQDYVEFGVPWLWMIPRWRVCCFHLTFEMTIQIIQDTGDYKICIFTCVLVLALFPIPPLFGWLILVSNFTSYWGPLIPVVLLCRSQGIGVNSLKKALDQDFEGLLTSDMVDRYGFLPCWIAWSHWIFAMNCYTFKTFFVTKHPWCFWIRSSYLWDFLFRIMHSKPQTIKFSRGGHAGYLLIYTVGKLLAFNLSVSARFPGDTLEPVLIAGAFLGGAIGNLGIRFGVRTPWGFSQLSQNGEVQKSANLSSAWFQNPACIH